MQTYSIIEKSFARYENKEERHKITCAISNLEKTKSKVEFCDHRRAPWHIQLQNILPLYLLFQELELLPSNTVTTLSALLMNPKADSSGTTPPTYPHKTVSIGFPSYWPHCLNETKGLRKRFKMKLTSSSLSRLSFIAMYFLIYDTCMLPFLWRWTVFLTYLKVNKLHRHIDKEMKKWTYLTLK